MFVSLQSRAAAVHSRGLYATRQKEQFSLAFIQAVAAAAGCNVARADVDDDSVDLELIGPHDADDRRPSPHLAIQAKCTELDGGDGDVLPLPLKLKNYNDLRAPCHVPRLLVVVCVPSDVASWLTATSEALVLLPHHHDWRDYLDLMTAMVDTVARAEERSALSVLQDLATATSDVVRLRAVTGPTSDGTIGVGDGLRLVECLRRVFLAAACTAIEPRRAYHKRKFTEATRFVDRLRLGQTERGSFVLTALSPVTPALTDGAVAEDADPFERRVTRTLAQALSGLESAALQGSLESQIEPFEREVEHGVSADLCEAIALLGESEVIEQVDFDIRWSPVRPAPAVAQRASFARAVFPVIRSAGVSFRERTPIEEFELEGITTHITRPGEARRGEARILAVIDGRQRLVAVAVDGQDWEVASKSLTERVLLRCDGELRRVGSTFVLEHPRNFRLAVS